MALSGNQNAGISHFKVFKDPIEAEGMKVRVFAKQNLYCNNNKCEGVSAKLSLDPLKKIFLYVHSSRILGFEVFVSSRKYSTLTLQNRDNLLQ